MARLIRKWHDPKRIAVSPLTHDMEHTRLGKVTVLYPVGREDAHVLWLCYCDCGEHFLTRTTTIAKRRIHSCGKCETENGNVRFYPVKYTKEEVETPKQRDFFNEEGGPAVMASLADAMEGKKGQGGLTELEQRADDEARHAHREIVEGLSPEVVRLSAVLNEFGKMSTFEQRGAINYLSALYLPD